MGNVAVFKGKVVKFLAKAGILLPQREQSERSTSPENGELAYNSTFNKVEVYENSEWRQVSTAPASLSALFSNNQTTPANVNGFVLPSSSSKYLISIARQTVIGNKYETLDLIAVSKDSSFEISVTGVGDETGVYFTVDSTGQIKYTSTDDFFHLSGQISWKQQVVL